MTVPRPTLAEFRAVHGVAGESWAYIYGLHDPRTEELRYIGKSIRPLERLGNQMNERSNTHRCHWLQELRSLGLRPIQVIIDAVPADSDWQSVERAYIRAARSDGARLTNNTDGGDGVPGLPAETRARITSAWKGRKHSPATLALMSANRKGRKHTDEWRQLMSTKFRGRVFSAEHRRKLSAGVSKLTADEVREIRGLLRDGVLQKDVAVRFGVNKGTISNISRGKFYRDVI